MFRESKSSTSALSVMTAATEAKKTSDYTLYLLPDNKPASLAQAELNIGGGNSVLLYPDSTNTSSSSSGSRKYKACFIQHGKLLKNGKSELTEVTLGNHVLTGEGLLTATITPNYANIINMALSKARITIPFILRTSKAVMESCIIPDVDTKSLIAFSQASFYTNTLTKPALAKKAAKKLLIHVVRGEEAEAKKMLEANPQLLLERGLVTDYSGRQIEGTAFALALGAEDIEMCEMITPYFNRLTDQDGETERLKQYQAQFPEQEEKKEEKDEVKREDTPDIVMLKQLMQTISISNTDEECEPALAAFREFLKPKGVIKTGKHFNANLLLKAFQLYDENYMDFGHWNSRKNNLCWRKVVGYIQRFLPACYAQAFCQGLYGLVERGDKLKRSLNFLYDPGIFFFPLSSSGVGYEYAVRAPEVSFRGHGAFAGCPRFQNLCRAKTSALRCYATRVSFESAASPVLNK